MSPRLRTKRASRRLGAAALVAALFAPAEFAAAASPSPASGEESSGAIVGAGATTSRRGRASRSRTRPEPEVSRVPRMGHPSVHVEREAPSRSALGWSGAASKPRLADRRRRLWTQPIPADYASTLHVGERFVFDVYFAGNPTGMAEASVIAARDDPRGGPPAGEGMFVLQGKATTSGVVSLLTSMVDVMTTTADARSGAPLRSVNVLDRSGFGTKVKKRVTETDFAGRGHLRIVDDHDGDTTRQTRTVPRDTFDPLTAMAWVRSLDLDDGERANAHVMDGRTLLRIDVVGRGHRRLDALPSIASGLGIGPEDLVMLEGTVTRVDEYGRAKAGKRSYTFRAFLADDERRLLIAVETDMWLGVIRLVLARYDPPPAAADEPAAP